MNLILALAILTASPLAQNDGPAMEAVEVFRCNFDENADRNYDAWPDGWTRKRAPGFPLFLPIKIASETLPGGEKRQHLRLELDGGAATAYSPHLPVNSIFSYLVEGNLKTQDLHHDVAFYSLSFFDAHGKLLETQESPHLIKAKNWTPITIGPVMPSSAEAATAVIGLHLQPRLPGRNDLTGAALFGQIKLSRLPRVTLRCNQKHHIYHAPQQVEIACEVSGMLKPDPRVTFTLEDYQGQVLATHEVALTPVKPAGNSTKHHTVSTSGQHAGGHDAHAAPEKGYSGRASWKPPIPGFGFYRVAATMQDAASGRLQRHATLVVARPITTSPEGEFGWTLPQGDQTMTLSDLVPLLSQSGIHWLKFPMWYSETDVARPDRLAWFADRVGAQHIQVIGILDTPPAAQAHPAVDPPKVPIATAFVEAPFWKPAVDPVMTRLSLKVRWWQLGADDDISFVGYPQLEQKIAEIKQHFLKFGQEVQVGIAWPWTQEPTVTNNAPWDFLSRTEQPALTPSELSAYLGTPKPGATTPQRWLTLEPLSRKHYALPTRMRDLVERMLAAKRSQAQGVFIPDPFSRQHGLLNADGTPSELFLAWRTTAMLLGGAEYLGSMQLPNGSVNHLFRRDQQAIMVVWNDTPGQETLYLGDQIEHIDLWGRTIAHREVDHDGGPAQQIEVGPLPTFVTGLSLPVTQWRISFAFETPYLPSIFGRDQTARYKFTNAFPQSVSGEIRLHASDDWEITPPVMNFRAAPDEELHPSFNLRFKVDAQSGQQMVRFVVKVVADRDYHFCVYQPIQVGFGDVSLETASRLTDDGDLVIDAVLVNQTDETVSFNCLLFAPGRRRERAQVMELGRGRRSVTFILPKGAELMGQPIVLRAEEIEGDRVLNYRVVPVE